MKKGIAIDGPSAAGKSTVSRSVAKKLGINYLNSGSFYRIIGYYVDKKGLTFKDLESMEEDKLLKLLDEIDIKVLYEGDEQINYLNDEKVSEADIRTEKMSMMASDVSQNTYVRRKVTSVCQNVAKEIDIIMEGRDIGTVVLKDAKLKIFMTADVNVRAKRRYNELLEKGNLDISIEEVTKKLEERDHQDSTRSDSPTKKADDAILIDSSSMTIEEVTNEVIKLYNSK